MTTIPDDEMRVARAILKARYYDCEPEMYGNDFNVFFASIDGDLVYAALDDAKAAIEAMQPAILAERERCARICEERGPATQDMTSTLICEALDEAAAAIRSQS